MWASIERTDKGLEKMNIETYGVAKGAKHLYSVEVRETSSETQNANRKQVDVYANNRTQAAKIAEMAGYEVCSVNMVG